MNTRIYLYVKAFSDLGTMMDQMVLSALIYTETGSNFWLSASLLLRVLGGVISSLYSGVLADRFDRRKLMVYSDVLRGVSVALLLVVPGPVMICLASALIGFLSSFFTVSFSAEIPQMFGEENVLETNSLISRLTYLAMLLGFIGAGIADFIGYKLLLSFDTATYLLSALTLMFVKWNRTVARGNNASVSKWKQLTDDMREVGGYLKLKRSLFVVFLVYLVEAFGAGSHNVGVPLLAAMLDPHKVAMYQGMIWGTWAVGSVLITWVIPKLRFVKERLLLVYFVTTVFMSSGFITYFSMHTAATILPFAFLTGIFDAGSGTIYSSLLQMSDNHIRGRVFGISSLINRGGYCIGFIVVPLLLEKVTLTHMVWMMHGTVISALFIALLYLYRTNRQALGKSVPVQTQGA